MSALLQQSQRAARLPPGHHRTTTMRKAAAAASASPGTLLLIEEPVSCMAGIRDPVVYAPDDVSAGRAGRRQLLLRRRG